MLCACESLRPQLRRHPPRKVLLHWEISGDENLTLVPPCGGHKGESYEFRERERQGKFGCFRMPNTVRLFVIVSGRRRADQIYRSSAYFND